APAREVNAAGGGVEGGKEHVGGENVRAAKLVEEGGFAGIRISHQCHYAQRRLPPLGALLAAPLAHGLQFLLDLADAPLNFAAVGFDLFFAWATHADAAGGAARAPACLARQVGP